MIRPISAAEHPENSGTVAKTKIPKPKQGDPLQRPCCVPVLVVPFGNVNRERRHEGRGRLFSDVENLA